MQVRQFSGGNCRTIRTDFKNGWWWCSHPFSSMFCYCPSTYVFQILTYLMMLRLAMKRKCELTPYKHNVSCRYSTPLPPHETKNSLSEILQNSNKTHIKLVSHLHEWQFFQLADKLKDLIIRPRLWDEGTRPQGYRKPPKVDHYHHLLFALCWLNEGLLINPGKQTLVMPSFSYRKT